METQLLIVIVIGVEVLLAKALRDCRKFRHHMERRLQMYAAPRR